MTILTLAFSIRWVGLALFMPRSYYIAYDTVFSNKVQQELNCVISNLWQLYRKCPRLLLQEIHKAHTFIDTVTIRCTSHRVLYIEIKAQKPLVVVNDRWLLTNSGAVFDKSVAQGAVCDELGQIQVIGAEKSTLEEPALLKFVKQLPVNFYNDYTITWVDKTWVELRQKSEPLFSIITTGEKLITPKILTACSLIQKEYNARTPWSIDIRFNELIIMGGLG